MKNIYIEHTDNIIINNDLKELIKYSDNQMKEISLKAWSLLSYILLEKHNIILNKDMIYYNEHNKPYLKDNSVYFNLSHSKNIVAIIVDRKECGIDIEYIDYSKTIDKITKKILSIKEQKKLKYKFDKHKYFFKLWTRKETYYKMQGTGIIYNQLNKNIKYKNIKSYIYKYNNDKFFVSFTK